MANALQQIIGSAEAAQLHGSCDFSSVYAGIVQLQQIDGKGSSQFQNDMLALNRELHNKGILSDLELTGVDDHNHLMATSSGQSVAVVAANVKDVFQPGAVHQSWWQGAENVAAEMGKGAWHELTHTLHPEESFAVGAVIGGAAVFAAPAVAIGLAVVGAGIASYEVATHARKWIHDTEVVAHPEEFSRQEFKDADKGVRAMGAGELDIAAGVAGGLVGGYGGNMLKAGLARPKVVPIPDEEPSLVTDDQSTLHHAHLNQPNVANISGQIQGDPTQGSTSAPLDPSSHHLHAALLTGNQSELPAGDESAVVAQTGTAPSDAAVETTPRSLPAENTTNSGTAEAGGNPAASDAATAEETALQQSIAQNQSIFRGADANDEVIEAEKQAYNVLFKKITEPGTITTLENRSGEAVQPGQWVAVRLDASNNPVLEDGIVNQWPVTEKGILKAYQVTPDQLQAANELIAGTKTGGAPVHMVQLGQDITIKTPWGSMSGKAGDWLANYDYDPATGTPGSDFAIVTKLSFKQTYQPLPKTS